MDNENIATTSEGSAPDVATDTTASVQDGVTAGVVDANAGTGAGTAPSDGVTTPAPEMLNIMGVQIDKSKVPPELLDKVGNWNKAYTQKSQEVSEYRKRAEAFDTLRNHPAFQQWYYQQINGQGQPSQPQKDPLELSPERQAELLSDPNKMRQYMEDIALNLIQKSVVPEVRKAQYEARTLKNEQEISRIAERHKDFDQLNNNGEIEKVLERYSQRGTEIDLEDAYWLAKRPYMESEATMKAQQRVKDKANGTTLPPSNARLSDVKVVPAKGLSFDQKLKMATEAATRGEKIRFDSNV